MFMLWSTTKTHWGTVDRAPAVVKKHDIGYLTSDNQGVPILTNSLLGSASLQNKDFESRKHDANIRVMIDQYLVQA